MVLMMLIWALAAAAAVWVGLKYRASLREVTRSENPLPRVDDAAIRTILETGRLSSGDSEPLDMEKASRAEEEFWNEYWDEPEEYRP